ncbi:MAG TPA: hypothetical protein VHV53_08165 [Solirubrobacterales bacterium]|nr:hypothetical protein [Solirubrobacterales bacterium]
MLGPEPVDKLLGGIAVALTEEVLPQVDDPLAQMQLKAAAELLGNLAGRTTWDPAQVDAETAELARTVAALEAAGGPRPQAPAEVADDAIGRRRETLAELAAGLRWLAESGAGDDRPRELWDRVHADLSVAVGEEIERLKRGMYR